MAAPRTAGPGRDGVGRWCGVGDRAALRAMRVRAVVLLPLGSAVLTPGAAAADTTTISQRLLAADGSPSLVRTTPVVAPRSRHRGARPIRVTIRFDHAPGIARGTVRVG